MKNLTVVIPFRNGHTTIQRLLDSLPVGLPVIVVDDVSDTPLHIERKNTRIIRPEQRGYFSGAVNVGINACITDVLVLNQDSWFEGDVWQAQVSEWQQSGYAIAGDGVMKHPAWPAGYVQGTCMFMSHAAIAKVGLLNVVDYPLWGATAEWQLRACRAGFTAMPCEVEGFNHTRKGNFGSAIAQTLNQEPDKKDLLVRTPPAITVVIPCYNYGRYLSDAMASLLGGDSCLGERAPQTFQSFEIVIIDDASTDNSWEIIQRYADAWRGVRVMRNARNLGTAATLNAAIKTAYGKYITFLSADDMMEPQRLERLYRAAVANPHRVIYDDLQLFKDGHKTEPMRMQDYDFEKTLHKNQMHAGIMYEKRAWQECNGYPEIMRDGREDWAFNVALGARGYCGIHIPELLYLYRREQQNRSVKNTSVQWYQTYRSRMQALYPELYRGERPTMCCGNNKKSSARSSSRSSSGSEAGADIAPIGSEGMTLLEYAGQRGPSTYYATEPNQTYIYGGKYHYIYVDNRHVDQMLAAMEGRRNIFRRGTMPTPHLTESKAIVEPAPDVVTVPEPVIVIEKTETVKLATVADETPATPAKRYTPKKKAAIDND